MTETSVHRDSGVAGHLRADEELDEDVPFRMRTDRPRRGVVIVSVSGPLDMVTIPGFARLVQDRVESAAGVIVLDLAAVSFLGVEAIKVLAQADLRAHLAGKRLSLVTGVRAVDRPLEALGLAGRFTYGSRPVFGTGATEAVVPTRREPVPQQPAPHHEALLSRP